jgi:hypothetical protein
MHVSARPVLLLVLINTSSSRLGLRHLDLRRDWIGEVLVWNLVPLGLVFLHAVVLLLREVLLQDLLACEVVWLHLLLIEANRGRTLIEVALANALVAVVLRSESRMLPLVLDVSPHRRILVDEMRRLLAPVRLLCRGLNLVRVHLSVVVYLLLVHLHLQVYQLILQGSDLSLTLVQWLGLGGALNSVVRLRLQGGISVLIQQC